MHRIKTDILVIGAGSGGLSVAAGAAQMGADVTLLEGHKMGGDCLNYGCVPSKALLAAGKRAAQARHGDLGVKLAAEVDFAAVKTHVADVIKTIEPHDSIARFEGLGVRVIPEFGRFLSPHEVQAGDHRITARRIVIATGARPFIPPIEGLDGVPYLTNETIFAQKERPDHLLVIGAGPIGLEMAQAHRRLGAQVTVIEGARALAQDDPEMAQMVLETLRSEGITLLENTKVRAVSGQAGAITVIAETGERITGSHLLVAAGRTPNVERLDLAAGGIDFDRGGIKVNAGLRTRNRRVFAIGDVIGGMQFTHVAGYHAGLVIRSALFGLPIKRREDHIPRATYTDPELAQVGMTEAQARAHYGARLEVARFDFKGNDRLLAQGAARGMIKMMVVKGRPVGVSIVGPQAGELINLWAMVIANRLKVAAVANMVSPYPSVGEINKRVAGAYFSPRLFDSIKVKRIVGFVQRWLP